MVMNQHANLCSANTKSTGERCRNPTVKGFNVCRMHGAGNRTRKRDGSPAVPGGRPLIHGRYSTRYQELLPGPMAENFIAAVEDADLMTLYQRVALIDSLLTDLLKQLDTGESGAAWKQLRSHVKGMDDNLRDSRLDAGEKNKRFSEGWGELKGIVKRGVGQHHLRGEIASTVDTIRRLVDTEAKRVKVVGDLAQGEIVRTLAGQLMRAAEEVIDDKRLFNALFNKVRGITIKGDG